MGSSGCCDCQAEKSFCAPAKSRLYRPAKPFSSVEGAVNPPAGSAAQAEVARRQTQMAATTVTVRASHRLVNFTMLGFRLATFVDAHLANPQPYPQPHS